MQAKVGPTRNISELTNSDNPPAYKSMSFTELKTKIYRIIKSKLIKIFYE